MQKADKAPGPSSYNETNFMSIIQQRRYNNPNKRKETDIGCAREKIAL